MVDDVVVGVGEAVVAEKDRVWGDVVGDDVVGDDVVVVEDVEVEDVGVDGLREVDQDGSSSREKQNAQVQRHAHVRSGVQVNGRANEGDDKMIILAKNVQSLLAECWQKLD